MTPVAWLAYATDASESSFVTLFREQAEAAAKDWGWSVEPLFAGLTDAEREAIDRARRAFRDMDHNAMTMQQLEDYEAICGLLERTCATGSVRRI